jgi:hypothetical protein
MVTRMTPSLAVLALFAATAACTVEAAPQQPNPKTGDVIANYSGPALCKKQLECDATASPVDECIAKVVKIYEPQADTAWPCTRAKVQQCATAYESISCDAVSNPDASCGECGFGKI